MSYCLKELRCAVNNAIDERRLQLRANALERAIASSDKHDATDVIVSRARAFYDFLADDVFTPPLDVSPAE